MSQGSFLPLLVLLSAVTTILRFFSCWQDGHWQIQVAFFMVPISAEKRKCFFLRVPAKVLGLLLTVSG